MTKREIKRVIDDAYALYGGKPPIDVVANGLNVPVAEAKLILAAFEKPKEMKKKKRKLPSLSELPFIIIRILMGLIGIGASVMSGYYTSVWLMEFLSMELAVFLSLLMILFAVLSFQIIIVFFQSRSYWLIALFGILYLIVTIFSMGSTVAGQYNKNKINSIAVIEQNRPVVATQMMLDQLNEQKSFIMTQITEKKENKNNLLTLLKEFSTLEIRKENAVYYNDIQWRMGVVDQDITKLNQQIVTINNQIMEEIRNQPDTIVAEDKAEYANFYTWLGSILKASSDIVQFWLSVFPAIFIDVIAPTGVAVSLFLRRRV